MPEIKVSVQNKIAEAEKGKFIVCRNSDYTIKFDFDSEWSGYNFKTALFVFNGKLVPVPFDGNVCKVPKLKDTTLCAIGVKASNSELSTSTPALVPCKITAEDLAEEEIPAPTQDVYDEIIALINKYIGQGNNSIDEEAVKKLIEKETADLQSKTDESLQTESKEMVGAINEVKGLAETARMVFGETEGTAYEGNKGKANADNIAKLQNELAIVNVALEQSGLVKKYKQPITQEYNERVTANGLNVLDGSKAVLKKVVGNTVACKNLVDIPFIDATIPSAKEISVNFSQDIFVSVGELATVSSSVWRFQFVFKDGTSLYIMDIELERGGKKISATNDNPIVKIAYRGERITAGRYSKIMIAYGDTATEYQPYFTGLKSASFGGIESGGKNLWNGTWELGAINSNTGEASASSSSLISSFVPVVGGLSIAISGNIATPYMCCAYDKDKNFIRYVGSNAKTATLASNEVYLRIMQYENTAEPTNVQIEYGTTATEYTPYIDPILFFFPKTPTPLGTTIDFENKKITDYGVEITSDYPSIVYTEATKLFTFTAINANASFNLKAVSSYYPYDNFGSSGSTGFWITSDGEDLRIRDSRFTSVAELKTWMAENNVTIRYLSSTLQSETDFTESNEYIAYNGGREKVLENDGKDYGADNTLTQDYILVTEV